MKHLHIGQSMRVIQGRHEYAATIIGLDGGLVQCRIDIPGGPQVRTFYPNGQPVVKNGMKLKKARAVGVKVVGTVE